MSGRVTSSKWNDACQQWTITLEREKQDEKEKRIADVLMIKGNKKADV